jgi:hypothetical protein
MFIVLLKYKGVEIRVVYFLVLVFGQCVVRVARAGNGYVADSGKTANSVVDKRYAPVPFIFGRFDVPPIIARPLGDQSACF